MFLIILLILYSVHAQAETTIRSELTEEGSFCNRLRYANDTGRFSLISEFNPDSEDGAIRLEPSLRTRFFSAGRLTYTGLLTEMFNPDNLRAGSAALVENTALKTDDSFSAGPRLGFFSEFPNISLWMFRNNEDFFSAGADVSGMQSGVSQNSKIYTGCEANFILSAITKEQAPDGWFCDNPVNPPQLCLNTSAEMRLVSGGGFQTDRRRQMNPGKDENKAACSLFAAFSLPQYTVPGWLLRGSLTCGKTDHLLRMMAMHSSSNYLTPAGEVPVDMNTAGIQAGWNFSFSKLDIAADFEYLYRQNRPLPLYSHRIGQSNEIKAQLSADFLIFGLSSAFKYSVTYLPNTNREEYFHADAGVEVEAGPVTVKIMPEAESLSSLMIPEYTYAIRTAVSLNLDTFKTELSYKYSDLQHETKLSMNISHKNNRILLKISSQNMTDFNWSAAVDVKSE